jgi:hypothetical protein
MRTSPVMAIIDDDYALVVGRVITMFAYEEWMLRDIVYRLVDMGPKNGRLIVKDFRAKEYPDIIKTLAEINKIDITFDSLELEKLLEECESNRNMFAHSIWLQEDDGSVSIQITRGNWPKTPHNPKVKKQVSPEGRTMTPEYALLIYELTEASIRATIPIYNAVVHACKGRTSKHYKQHLA